MVDIHDTLSVACNPHKFPFEKEYRCGNISYMKRELSCLQKENMMPIVTQDGETVWVRTRSSWFSQPPTLISWSDNYFAMSTLSRKQNVVLWCFSLYRLAPAHLSADSGSCTGWDICIGVYRTVCMVFRCYYTRQL